MNPFAESLPARLQPGSRVLLTGPEDLDGDSVGACLGLAHLLRQLLPGIEVKVAGNPGFRYGWLPGADHMLSDRHVNDGGPWSAVVVMDGDRHRLGPGVRQAFAEAGLRAIVDHHGTTSPEGYELAFIDRSAASTCGMVLELADAWALALDPVLAQHLYVGMIFDTGGFRFSNTTPATHAAAARLLDQGIDHADIAIRVLMERRPEGLALHARVLADVALHGEGRVAIAVVRREDFDATGANGEDIEGLVDALVYLRGVEVGCLVIQRGERTKLSLRSRGGVDVAQLARRLSEAGGGHAKAAGCSIAEPVESVVARLPEALVKALG